ncbi:putative ubiquitin-conjugating enzyme E2 38 [Salvia splendens]|uniref:putative ubiquitin-conjugating enzyme E2 38 n=1 Tax=Salvia splendens TaxID=180675 RepID=UPI001C266367|nr:putative ubiquitin-conjugating enzyme E2 38 [Salvia splendens]XP_042040664.1 putative ubiquitin-conjugating enzyme E2 38 [Salvia splendens]
MESATAFPQYIALNSKFSDGGSKEVPPPAMDRSSKSKFEVPEIIDVDMLEDGDDASLMDSEVDGSAKGKKVLSNSSVGVCGLADEESGDNMATSNVGGEELEDYADDFSSSLYFGEDEWMDSDYDGMIYDDNDHLEAHFDNMELPPGVEAPVPWFRGSPKNDTQIPVKGPSTSTHSGSSLRTGPVKVVDKIVYKFDNFAKFDTVDDHSDHYYSTRKCSEVASKNWAKRIQEEWKILEKNLPAEVYVRVYESRMDLLRAVIIGAEGTPYHDGLFFFDVYFPSKYPAIPPEVYYHSGGLRINPNLYDSGKVCLSLLNTWSGSRKEKWIPDQSTALQVLVSIQGLILNAKPYFNEPGYEGEMGTKRGEDSSSAYNENTFIYSLKTMIYSMQKPPKHFEDFVVGYFRKHARYILVSCVAYLNGAEVGCLVRGGVHDADKDNRRCSEQFKETLGQCITRLVKTFMDIEADGCQEFLAAAKKGSKTE